MQKLLPPGDAPQPVRLASYVVRVFDCGGRVEYAVRDLRSGVERRFIDPRELQTWLAATLGRPGLH